MSSRNETSDAKEYTIFMLVKAQPSWLALAPAERFGFSERVLKPLLKKHPAVRLRYFDAEAYSAEASDVLMWQSRDLGAYQGVVEGLRETPFWDHYFRIVSIIPAREDAYAEHYGVETISAGEWAEAKISG